MRTTANHLIHPLRLLTAALVASALTACGDDSGSDIMANEMFEVDRTDVDFGQIRVGQRRSSDIRIRNTGNVAIQIRLESEALGGGLSAELETESLAPGGRTNLTIRFAPEVEGVREGSVFIRSGDLEPIEVTARGVGTQPSGEVSTTEIDFPSVLPTTTSSASFTISNTSLEALDVMVLPTNNVDRCGFDTPLPSSFCVVIPENATISLAPGASASVEVVFQPLEAVEMAEGTITVRFCNDNSPSCRSDILLTGSASGNDLTCSPEMLDFGLLNPGLCAGLDLTCRNEGNVPLTTVDARLSSTSGSEFSLNGALPITLGAGEMAKVGVIYCPQSLGMHSATVLVTSDREGRALREDVFPVVGVGGGPDIAAPESIEFGVVSTLAPARRSVVVRNRGDAPLDILDGQFENTGGGMFELFGDTPVTLAPGESVRFEVQVEPANAGEQTAQLVLLTNDRDSPMFSIDLNITAELLPPCTFTTNIPATGVIRLEAGPGETVATQIRIDNTGANPCQVTSIEVNDVSGPGLSVTQIQATSHRLQPGQRSTVTIRFQPAGPGLVTADFFFGISATSDFFNTATIEAFGL